MSPRTKVHLLSLVALPLGLAGLAGILNSTKPSLVVLALLYPVLIHIWAEEIRCPQCGGRIARAWYNLLGTRFLVPSCFVDRYCVHCDYDLDQRQLRAGGDEDMKQYRVSLEAVTSPTVTGAALAELLGLPPAELTEERRGRSVLWRSEPSMGQTGTLADLISRLTSEVRSESELRQAGVEEVSLGIDVRYDTFTCTVVIPLHTLVSLAESVPELDTVELTCAPSDRGATPSGDATKADANKYMVSLDAVCSGSATVAEVMDALGLPQKTFIVQRAPGGAIWSCEAEAEWTTDLAAQIGLLVSAAQPTGASGPGGRIREVFLDVGVIWDADETEACAVSLPVPLLCALAEKLPVGYVRVHCYPGSGEEGDG